MEKWGFKKVIVIFVVLVSLMMLMSGCSTLNYTTDYIEKEKLSLLKENQTTKAEVIQLIGKPVRTSPRHSEKGEVLTYDYVKANFMFSNEMERQTVNLFIDNAGILRKVTVNEGLENMAKKMGEFISPEKISLLKSKENQITKAEVIELLGRPDWIWPGEEGRGEILNYFRAKSKNSFVDSAYDIATAGLLRMAIYEDHTLDKVQRINLFIDDEGVLRKITVSDKPTKIRGGILAK